MDRHCDIGIAFVETVPSAILRACKQCVYGQSDDGPSVSLARHSLQGRQPFSSLFDRNERRLRLSCRCVQLCEVTRDLDNTLYLVVQRNVQVTCFKDATSRQPHSRTCLHSNLSCLDGVKHICLIRLRDFCAGQKHGHSQALESLDD